MNNTDLLVQITKLQSITNPLEQYIQIKSFNKDYKKSDFYKQTHLSLKKLMNYITVSKIQNIVNTLYNYADITYLAELFNQLLEELDEGRIENLAEKFLGKFQLDQIVNYNKELNQQISNLKQL